MPSSAASPAAASPAALHDARYSIEKYSGFTCPGSPNLPHLSMDDCRAVMQSQAPVAFHVDRVMKIFSAQKISDGKRYVVHDGTVFSISADHANNNIPLMMYYLQREIYRSSKEMSEHTEFPPRRLTVADVLELEETVLLLQKPADVVLTEDEQYAVDKASILVNVFLLLSLVKEHFAQLEAIAEEMTEQGSERCELYRVVAEPTIIYRRLRHLRKLVFPFRVVHSLVFCASFTNWHEALKPLYRTVSDDTEFLSAPLEWRYESDEESDDDEDI